MLKKNTAATLLILLLATIVFCSEEEVSRDSDNFQDLILSKKYGALKPDQRGLLCRDINSQSYDYERECSFFYTGDGQNPVRIKILIFKSEPEAKDFIIKGRIKSENNSLKKKDYNRYDGKDGIVYESSVENNIRRILWVSNNKIIDVDRSGGFSAAIPIEIVDDYQAKHPPSVIFKTSDFNEDKMIREGLEARYKKIALLEKDRDSSSSKYKKQEEYHSMIFQCEHELYIRCQLGLTDENNKVDCVNTFILDDSKRSAEWKNLEDMIKNHDIVYSNVYWAKMDKIKCDKDKDYEYKKKMIKALGLTKDDLKDWPVSSQLVEEEKK